MKNHILISLFLLLILLNACTKNDSLTPLPTTDSSTKPLIADAKKALTGTFIDFWDKGDWAQTQWNSQLQEMKDIGINTVIVQFTSYGDYTWFNSPNTFAKTKYPNALARLLTAAVNKKIDVYIGLYFNEEYWQNQTNVSWLQLHADRCISIATEINTQFGSNTAFKGWYIPHEPEPYAYNSAALVASFKNNFINKISDRLHLFNNKPVAIAAFFNSDLTTSNQLLYFMKELSKCNLQVIMLQDGVGVNHVSLNNLSKYYNDADWGLYSEGTGYAGEFWTDLETFQMPQAPADIARIKIQLQTELAMPHVSKAVSFQYYSDMCPTGTYGNAAKKLRDDYINYIKSLK